MWFWDDDRRWKRIDFETVRFWDDNRRIEFETIRIVAIVASQSRGDARWKRIGTKGKVRWSVLYQAGRYQRKKSGCAVCQKVDILPHERYDKALSLIKKFSTMMKCIDNADCPVSSDDLFNLPFLGLWDQILPLISELNWSYRGVNHSFEISYILAGNPIVIIEISYTFLTSEIPLGSFHNP